jgi:glycosyltransferase involved in cell wall biosynthesis
LVDDGSPDNCPIICDEYAEKYTQIKVIHKKNGGLSDARNVGIQSSRGDYIVLLDSDDLLASEDALANLYDVIVKTNSSVIFHSHLTTFSTDYDKSYDGIKIKQDCFTPICFYNTIRSNKKIKLAGWSFTIQRNFLLQNNLFFKVGILHEDVHWFPYVISTTDRIAINHDLFYAYREGRSGSIMATMNQKNILDIILIMNEFIEVTNEATCPITRKRIFLQYAAQLWVGAYLQLPVFFDTKSNKYKQALDNLNGNKNILFYGKKYKYILFRILLTVIGFNIPHIIIKIASKCNNAR